MPIAIIPARGGSRRIPRKNLALILGEPAISITIRNLKNFGMFENIVVSTEDKEIASVSESAGADVPFLRDKRLSDDLSPSEDVVRDVILKLGLQDSTSPIVCIYPLSVLLMKSDLAEGFELLSKNPDKFIISSVSVEPNPLRHTFKLTENNIHVIFPEHNEKRSQDIPNVFSDCGLFYIANPSIWLDTKKYWYNNNAIPLIIPKSRAYDVDNLEDLLNVERAYRRIAFNQDATF